MSAPFSEESLRRIAEQKYDAKISVKIHLAIFCLVNAMLLIINILTLPEFLWVAFPFFGWLIGLTMHLVAYILWARGVYPMTKRLVIFTISGYSTVVLLLFMINYVTLNELTWAFYPALFIGVGAVAFNIIYIILCKTKISPEGERISRKQRAVEKEMEKLRKRMNK
ncbi:MAG: 2TM domain-containing protein [Promethearchaeota archaeon]|nr:MAG: 2TM domain-containing protein [Candidatus Lokiarchaeota archaeon]